MRTMQTQYNGHYSSEAHLEKGREASELPFKISSK